MPPRHSREVEQPVVMGDSLKDQFRTFPHETSYPVGNPIQKMRSLVEKGCFGEALCYLRARNPFLGATGWVRPHFCQAKCSRDRLEGYVNMQALERAAYDHTLKGTKPFIHASETDKHVVVAGGGPVGMTAAYFLSLLGHDMTVYESGSVLGGILRYAVPGFRLPRDVVDRETGWILETNVHACVNVTVGKGIFFVELCTSSDAAVVATGTPKENALSIPNVECGLKAMEFLRKTTLGQRPDVGRTVVIMDGGGVAFDCAFIARRPGAADVHVLCLEAEGAIRVPEEGPEQARQESVHAHNGCTMPGVRKDDGRVPGVGYFDVRECRFDEQGRLSLIPVSGGEHVLACDTVIFAVDMKTDLGFFEGEVPECTPRQWTVADAAQRTSLEGVLAAGDVASRPSLIAGAVGAGHRATFGAHVYLIGENSRVHIVNKEDRIKVRDRFVTSQPLYVVPFEETYGVEQYGRAEPQRQGIRERLSFRKTNEGYTPEQVWDEAAHCMHRGHYKGYGTCVDDCPGYMLEPKHLEERDRPEVAFGDECWYCANCRISHPRRVIGFLFSLRIQV